MKKIHLIFAAALALSVSCNKEMTPSTQEQAGVKLCFSVESPVREDADKAVLQDEVKFYWSKNDQIKVFRYNDNGIEGSTFTATNGSASAEAVFEGTVSAPDTSYFALYPASASAKLFIAQKNNADLAGMVRLETSLPREQKAVLGGFDPAASICVGNTKAADFAFQMKHVTSLISFTITSNDVAKVVIYGNNGESLTGSSASTFTNGNYSYTVTNCYAGAKGATSGGTNNIGCSPYSDVILTPDGANTFAPGTYYASVYPVNFTKGFTLELTDKNGGVKMRGTSKETNLKRGHILPVGNVDEGVTYDTRKNYVMEFSDGSKVYSDAGQLFTTAFKSYTKGSVAEYETVAYPGFKIKFLCDKDFGVTTTEGLVFRSNVANTAYLELPAIEGQTLREVRIDHIGQGVTFQACGVPVIAKTDGSVVVPGYSVIAEGSSYSFHLGRAAEENTAYRILITATSKFKGRKITAIYETAPKLSETIVVKFWEGPGKGSVSQPFTVNIPSDKITYTDAEYTLKSSGYKFVINGQGRMNASNTYRGLRFESKDAYIKLPAINGLKLTKIEAEIGGVGPDGKETDEERNVAAKSVAISATSAAADKLSTLNFAACTLASTSKGEVVLSGTQEGVSYYFITEQSATAFKSITLYYSGNTESTKAGTLTKGDSINL